MKLTLTTLFLSLSIVIGAARDLTFAWDPNTEPDIKGYYIEISTDNGATWVRKPDVLHPLTEIRVTGIPNTKILARAYAFDTAGMVSLPSTPSLIVEPDRPNPPKNVKRK